MKPVSSAPRSRKLSIAIAGFSNSGKTYTAIAIANQLRKEGEKWIILDTDNERSNLYSTVFNTEEWLDAIYLPNDEATDANNYLEFMELASSYSGIIVDSITPFWHGVKKHVVNVAEKSAKEGGREPDLFSAWDGERGGNMVLHRFLTMVCDPLRPHTICTIDMKEGTKRVETTLAGGQRKTVISKIGPVPIFRQGEHKYRFSFYTILELTKKGGRNMFFEKATASRLEGKVYTDGFPCVDGVVTISKDGQEIIDGLKEWINDEEQ